MNDEIIIDGEKVTEEDLECLRENKKIRLKEISHNVYKTLEKLEG